MKTSFAQRKLTTAAGTIPYRGSFDGGMTWNGANNGANPWPANGWKLRLYCPYQTGTVTAYGTGKQGSGAIAPLQAVEGYPSLGNEIRFVLRDTAGRILNSTHFEVAPPAGGRGVRLHGRGYGHGVGMCVIGAGRRARRGETTADILKAYYPGLKIEQLTTTNY